MDGECVATSETPFNFTAFCLNISKLHVNKYAINKTPVL